MRRSKGAQPHATSRVVDGWSESAWKSLAIKSLRIGWAEGLGQAEQRLTRSTLEMLLLASVFEDVFPPASELHDVVAEIKARDWQAVCARETHHGRGYTEAFCELEPRAVAAARDPSRAAVEAGLGEWVRDGRKLRADSWVGYHTFRHTCATLLFRRGWNAVQVQRWLGHHKPSFTLDAYVHLLDEDVPEPTFFDALAFDARVANNAVPEGVALSRAALQRTNL